jgi:hypothetical protein
VFTQKRDELTVLINAQHITHTFWHIFGENPGALVWDTLVRENSLSDDLQQHTVAKYSWLYFVVVVALYDNKFCCCYFPWVSLLFLCLFWTLLGSNPGASITGFEPNYCCQDKLIQLRRGKSLKGVGRKSPLPPFPFHLSTHLWLVVKIQWREKLCMSYFLYSLVFTMHEKVANVLAI